MDLKSLCCRVTLVKNVVPGFFFKWFREYYFMFYFYIFFFYNEYIFKIMIDSNKNEIFK